jgi:hypothetical protein
VRALRAFLALAAGAALACVPPGGAGDGGDADAGADGDGSTDAGPEWARAPEARAVSPWTAEVTFALFDAGAASVTTGATTQEAPTATEHRFVFFNLAPAQQHSFHVAAGPLAGDVSATLATARTARVRFDTTHGATAGAADWTLSGDYSRFGASLSATTRYAPESGGIADLSGVVVLVLPEPNNWTGTADTERIAAYLSAGGSVFAIADHWNSDRDNDGLDSPRILNPLFATLGAGITFDSGSNVYETSGNFSADRYTPGVEGPAGRAAAIAVYGGASMTLASPARGYAFRLGANRTTRYALLACAEIGAGRLCAFSDSSAATNSAWDDAALDNDVLFLNTVAWLAREY